MKTINPYLIFNGNAEEAFDFYQSVFGGEMIKMRFSEMPGTEEMPDEDQNKLAHVALAIAGNDQVLMASDAETCIKHGLVDEFVIYMNPVIQGD